MLLARQGHEVTVLERGDGVVPGTPGVRHALVRAIRVAFDLWQAAAAVHC